MERLQEEQVKNMGTELVTTALHQVTLFGWWWILVPVVIGVLMIVVGLTTREEVPAGFGALILLAGTMLLAAINLSGPAYNKDLLRSDVSEQLQIEDTVKDGDWYLGKGPDGEFVRFTLVEKDSAEDTYAVLVEK